MSSSHRADGPRFIARFLDLAGHYRFTPRACKPARGGRRARTSEWVTSSTTSSCGIARSTAGRISITWLGDEAHQRKHGTVQEIVAERFAREHDVRVVFESLSEEFDPVDIATAAIKMVHVAAGGDSEEREILPPITRYERPDERTDRPRGEERRSRVDRSRRLDRPKPRHDVGVDGDVGVVRLFIGAGRDAGIRPGDLVGAITGEADVRSRSLGAIEIADKCSLVEVPDSLADQIIAALKATKIRGKKVTVRREKVLS